MRKLSKLNLAVAIAAALVAAGPAAAATVDDAPGAGVVKVLDRLLAAVFGGDQDTGHSIDPNGVAGGSESGSGDQDTGHSIDPDG